MVDGFQQVHQNGCFLVDIVILFQDNPKLGYMNPIKILFGGNMKLIIRTLMTSLLGLTVLVTSTQVMAKPKKSKHPNHSESPCGHLYVGKFVRYTLSDCLFGCDKSGVVVDVSPPFVSVRSEEDGKVRDKWCSDIPKH